METAGEFDTAPQEAARSTQAVDLLQREYILYQTSEDILTAVIREQNAVYTSVSSKYCIFDTLYACLLDISMRIKIEKLNLPFTTIGSLVRLRSQGMV